MEASPSNSPGNRSRLIFVGVILAAAMVALIVVLVGGEDDTKKSEDSSIAADCAANPADSGGPQLPCPDLEDPPADGTTATVSTSEGDFTITLAVKEAPAIATSFAYMADKGVYKDNSFTRIAPGFVIQGGDPTGTGSGGPGYTVTQAPPADETYAPWSAGMAKTGTQPPGASGSQFFVVIGTSSPLPPDYALLGDVTEGIETVNKISAVGTATGSDRPP